MPIRIPNVPGLPASNASQPRARPGPALAPAEALGDVARSIASVGDHFQGMADEIQRQENARLVSEKLGALKGAYASLQTELLTDPDPASRMERTRQFLAEQQTGMQDGPPAVQDALRERFDTFAGNAMIRQGEDSAKLQMQRTGLQLDNELHLAIDSGDASGARDVISRSVAAGIMLPEESEAKSRQIETLMKIRRFQHEAEADPLSAEKALHAPDFLARHPDISPDALDRLRSDAERKANRYRSDFTNNLIIGDVSPTEDELATMEEAGQISKDTRARWLVKIRSETPPPVDDPALYEETFAQIMAYDPARDPSGRAEANLRNYIASHNLPPAQVKQLNSKLTDRANPSNAARPRHAFEADFARKIDTDFTRGDFGKYRFPVERDGKLTTPINKDAYDKAWKLRGEFSEAWRGIVSALPEDASFEQINQSFDALKASFKDKMPLPDLSFARPTPMPYDPGKLYQSLPGKRAQFGGLPVKPAGVPYTGAAATVFGGKNDPADNGRSAFGGATGPGGKEGTAIPQALLAAKFPGKDKKWLAENVRTVVRGPDGVAHSLPVVDLGTAEWVWERAQRPTLDLTEGAAKQLGGKVRYTPAGKLAGVSGLDDLSFSVVSTDTGADLAQIGWEEAKERWFARNRPTSPAAIDNSLIALRQRWTLAQAQRQ